MNIYTLHKEGLFRPAPEGDSEIEHCQSMREERTNSNLEIVTEEKNGHETSDTSNSGRTSSTGEKTTPRHNVKTTPTNNFANNVIQHTSIVAASRIDATGEITGTNTPQVLSSKAALNNDAKGKQKKAKRTAYSKSKLNGGRPRATGVIQIQAKNEFMIFEDNTDLVSYITTPSAVRTSPLENDYLVVDHEEFAEDQSLFSAITIPKTLRRKKNKKKSKPKNNEDKKDTNTDEEKSKNEDMPSEDQEHVDLIVAPSSSNDESESREANEPSDVQPSTTPNKRRGSLDHIKDTCNAPNTTESGGRRSDLRGGRRVLKANDESAKSDHPSQADEGRSRSSSLKSRASSASLSSQQKGVKGENKKGGETGQEKNAAEEDASKDTSVSISRSKTEKSSNAMSVTSQEQKDETALKISPSSSDVESTDHTSQKSQTSQDQKPEQQECSEEADCSQKCQETVDINKEFLQNNIKAARNPFSKAPSYGLDATARTVIDSTARTVNDGSNEGSSNCSNVRPDEPVASPRKVPNSRRRGKTLKTLLLPLSYCCNRKKEVQEGM